MTAPLTIPETTRPGTPRPVDTRPAPRPTGSPPPSVPRPGKLLADPTFRMALAFIAVGVLILVAHYWLPYLLLAALPVKQWRAAA